MGQPVHIRMSYIDPAEYKALDADTSVDAHIAWVPPLQLPLHIDHLAS